MISNYYQSNNVVKRFYGSGVQVVTGPLGGVYVYQRDHLGSIRGVLDGAGNVVAAYDYDAWGDKTQTAGTFAADFGYAGYFEHMPSGLALTLFRGYSPLLGRWINRDPIGENGGLNLYSYVLDSPLNGTDPLGLFTFSVSGGYQYVPFSGGNENNSGYYWSGDGRGWFNSQGQNNQGLLAGAGVTFGFYRGNENDFLGPFENWNLQTPVAGVSIYWNSSTGKFMGLGISPGLGIGYANTRTTTCKQ